LKRNDLSGQGFKEYVAFENSARKITAAVWVCLWTLSSADLAHASFANVVGTHAAYCIASAQSGYLSEPCVVEELDVVTGSCLVETHPICPPDDTTTYASSEIGGAQGLASYVVEGDIGSWANLLVYRNRIDPEILEISGSYYFSMNVYSGCVGTGLCGTGEIALFRYIGDPASFAGVVPTTVADFVAAGLIESSDILFVHTDFLEPPDHSVPFVFDVSVSGVPDEQIYLFSTFQTPLPEPSNVAMLLSGASGLLGLARIKARRIGRQTLRNGSPSHVAA